MLLSFSIPSRDQPVRVSVRTFLLCPASLTAWAGGLSWANYSFMVLSYHHGSLYTVGRLYIK